MEALFFLVVAVLSLIIIILAAKYLVDAITSYATKTGFSDYIVGFLVVAIGTALPDLSTGIMAALAGHSELAFGDVIGANILLVTLVLGITLIIMRHFKNTAFTMKKTLFSLYLIILLPLIMSVDGTISRIDGLILVIVFFFYVLNLMRKEQQAGKVKKNVFFKHIIVDMLVFLFALGSLLLGSRYLVYSCIQLSDIINLPLFFIGLVFIALATTMPEIFIGIRSALSRHHNVSFGDVFGSVAINTTLVIGVAALISPIKIDFGVYLIPLILCILFTFIASLLFLRKEINYKHGLLVLSFYVLYVLYITLQTLYFR